MIRVTIPRNGPGVRRMADRIRAAMLPERVDPIVRNVAVRAYGTLVARTPKRWFGQVRQAWQFERLAVAAYRIRNGSVVMTYLERGTAGEGTGYIVPVRARMLYIPLNRAASFGWKPSLKRGVDYILRFRVRGIRPRRIVRTTSAEAGVALSAAARAYLASALSPST